MRIAIRGLLSPELSKPAASIRLSAMYLCIQTARLNPVQSRKILRWFHRWILRLTFRVLDPVLTQEAIHIATTPRPSASPGRPGAIRPAASDVATLFSRCAYDLYRMNRQRPARAIACPNFPSKSSRWRRCYIGRRGWRAFCTRSWITTASGVAAVAAQPGNVGPAAEGFTSRRGRLSHLPDAEDDEGRADGTAGGADRVRAAGGNCAGDAGPVDEQSTGGGN